MSVHIEQLTDRAMRERTHEAAGQLMAATAINLMAASMMAPLEGSMGVVDDVGIAAIVRFVKSVRACADLEIAKLAGEVPS